MVRHLERPMSLAARARRELEAASAPGSEDSSDGESLEPDPITEIPAVRKLAFRRFTGFVGVRKFMHDHRPPSQSIETDEPAGHRGQLQ